MDLVLGPEPNSALCPGWVLRSLPYIRQQEEAAAVRTGVTGCKLLTLMSGPCPYSLAGAESQPTPLAFHPGAQ